MVEVRFAIGVVVERIVPVERGKTFIVVEVRFAIGVVVERIVPVERGKTLIAVDVRFATGADAGRTGVVVVLGFAAPILLIAPVIELKPNALDSKINKLDSKTFF